MKQNIKCPYLQNGICYHAHCIYKPDLQCNKRETIKLSKKSKTRVKPVKKIDISRMYPKINEDSVYSMIKGERGNGKFTLLRKEDK